MESKRTENQLSNQVEKSKASLVAFKCRRNLCLWEKYFIICKPEMSTLNRRNEMTLTCKHSKKFL